MPKTKIKINQEKAIKAAKKKLQDLEVCVVETEKNKELDQSRMALMNMLEDVEEARKKAEEERERAASIVNNLSDGLIVLNRSRIYLVNPQAEKFLGTPQKELVGRKLEDINEIERMKALAKTFKKGRDIFRQEVLIDKNLTLEMSTVPMVVKGENIGLMIILHDITREKTVERMKTEFVSLAAHQLRTPLSVIKWTLKMLMEGDMGEVTEGQRDLIEKSYQSNERMIGLINDLLDITRIEEGRYLYQPVLADLVDVAGSVFKDREDEIKRKGLVFHFQKPRGRVPRVTMDVEKMKLVIQNLLENAIRYTPAAGKVSASINADKDKIEFKIEDGGIGIPRDQQAKIFTKFFRGSNVIRVETEGSGLGLFISKNIVEAHGGKIWFESKEGSGSIFHFSLPVKKELESFLKEF